MIILAGGGDPDQVREIDEWFAGQIDKEKRVVYIPVAMEESVFTYPECEVWFGESYAPYRISNVEMWTDLRGKKLNDEIAAVFIGGGNTFKLLKQMREEGFAETLCEYEQKGGVVYGGSAGAILMGKTIETALHADENSVGLDDFRGLDLLNGMDVWCHYADEEREILNEYPHPAYVLREESGLVFVNGQVRSLGAPYIQYTPKK